MGIELEPLSENWQSSSRFGDCAHVLWRRNPRKIRTLVNCRRTLPSASKIIRTESLECKGTTSDGRIGLHSLSSTTHPRWPGSTDFHRKSEMEIPCPWTW